jgi:hypothetical protein
LQAWRGRVSCPASGLTGKPETGAERHSRPAPGTQL